MTSLQGAVVLVTGGNRGIGKAVVDDLLTRGAAKVYATSRKPEPSTDPRVVTLPLEVTDQASIEALVEAAPGRPTTPRARPAWSAWPAPSPVSSGAAASRPTSWHRASSRPT